MSGFAKTKCPYNPPLLCIALSEWFQKGKSHLVWLMDPRFDNMNVFSNKKYHTQPLLGTVHYPQAWFCFAVWKCLDMVTIVGISGMYKHAKVGNSYIFPGILGM
jgi:hypothetical protein